MDDKSNQSEINKTSPRKRVLFVITQSELGGAQRFVHDLVTHLDKSKYEIAVATGSTELRRKKQELGTRDYELPDQLEMAGIKTIRLKHLRREVGPVSDFRALLELKRIISEFNPDTLFLLSSKVGLLGSFVSKFLIHNSKFLTLYRIGGWSFNDPRAWWKNLLYRWLEKISAPWKDYIIVNNKHDYEQTIRYRIKPRKEVVLVHNGIDPYKLDFLEKDEAKIRLYELLPPSQKHAGFLHEGLMIGTIANFYPTKGLGYLIEAFKIVADQLIGLPACKLVIIGDGPERENLKSLIINYQLQNTIFLAGRIPDAHKYLKAFDIFVLPSVKEGFPWALLEAMSAKLPVIVTAVGANPEIIENDSPPTTLESPKVVGGKNGFLVPSRDSQALADAIGRLAQNDVLRRELGIQAHQTVIHKFDLRKMVEQIETLL